ncbi:cyclic GMP-AMP synthase [Morone saxatilis]|uniref:cyclic GMP-AMP synthase n=1 Tax=Morone saxatilis TaxID=34816 RepID=UPI0015E24F7D|nr:cyclic GMP-AMP synthase [Morone saxatilis]
MAGRGRPRKAKSPDNKCAMGKTKQTSLPGCPGKGFTEERQNGTIKEQKPREQKKSNHTEEKPSVHKILKEKTTKQFTEEQRTPTESFVQGENAKTCAGRSQTTKQSAEKIKPLTETLKDTTKPTKAKTNGGKTKSQDTFLEEMTKMRPETPKETLKETLKTTKEKTCTTKAKTCEKKKTKSQDGLSEEMTKMKPETPKETLKTTKAKMLGGKAKSPAEFTEETTKMQPKTPKDTAKAFVRDKCEDKAAVDSVLHNTLEKLKIRKNDRSDAAEVINKVIKNITMHLKQNSQCFQEVEDPLHTGSYYENLKISNPDEFDVMLPIPVDRVDIKPFGADGAFYSVALKRGKSPLQKFQETITLSASTMLEEFRKEVMTSVKQFTEWKVTKKKKGCPAVTLITTVKSIIISLDVVLCIMVKSSWPPLTKEGLKIEGWLGTKVKQDYKRKAYYLVPKYYGSGQAEEDGVLAKDIWRVSFSHIEKAIIKNHGSEKTCCEKGGTPCCRKDCLKLLKHLLSLLKEENSSFDKFYSYHAKTMLLHACCSRTKDTDWKASSLSHCFKMLLQDFVGHLEEGVLNNFFIPTQNLLSDPGQKRCRSLAQRIREEFDKGFPIFK